MMIRKFSFQFTIVFMLQFLNVVVNTLNSIGVFLFNLRRLNCLILDRVYFIKCAILYSDHLFFVAAVVGRSIDFSTHVR